MKHLKIIGLAVIAAAAFMAFAANASAAPAVTSPSGTEYTGHLEATVETDGTSETLILKAGFVTYTCTTSTVTGEVHTNDETLASGPISTLDFTGCNATVDTIVNGSLEVTTGGGVNTVKGRDSQVTLMAIGTSCVYGTAAGGTTLGTATGGTPATMTISASLPKISGGFACANPAAWEGKYTVTKPSTLLFDA